MPTFDVDALLGSLARDPPQTIPFVEARASPLLEREITLEGTLEYLGRGKLTRNVTAPYVERTVIDGESVRIRREGRNERGFSLEHAPALGGFLAGLAAILSGDRATLEREFEISSAGTADDWQLTLVPRSREVRERVGRIRLRGADDSARCIVTMSTDGGTTAELVLGPAAAEAGSAEQRALHCNELP